MGMDFRKRIYSFFLNKIKANKYLKLPMLACMTVILFFYYIFRHFADNGKRYAGMGLALTFFMLSSSFAFPVSSDSGMFVSADMSTQDKPQAAENTGEDPAEEAAFPEEEAGAECGAGGQKAGERFTLDDILEGDIRYRTKEKSAESTGQADRTVFTADDWRLVLINKQHPIPEDYTFELVTIKGSMQCDERILEDLLRMLQGAREDNVNLVIRSPYRDMSRQEYLFDRKVKNYMNKGMSYMEAYKTASMTVTVPGASEHQIGLAIDITSDTYAALDEGFGETEAGKWLAEHSCEYGFILRYPKGKEYITSIDYEPWHFRYVGKEAAVIIMENKITLEEFTEKYIL